MIVRANMRFDARWQGQMWIRNSGEPDAVIDFDRMVRDPVKIGRLRAEFDSGDHLHSSDAGYRAMGNGIDLRLFP